MASSGGVDTLSLPFFPPVDKYMDILEQASNFNSRLSSDRKMRLPFLDSQTGVAQRHTNLFHPYRHRQPGSREGQLYSYPAKKWKKKKKSFLFSDRKSGGQGEVETGETDMHQISAVENPAHRLDEHDYEHYEQTDIWYDDADEFGGDHDDGGGGDDPSDISDYEDSLKGRKKKKATPKGRRKRQQQEDKDAFSEDKDKPFVCDACGARYKTRPGLSYHHTHFHNAMRDEDSRSPSPKPQTRTSAENPTKKRTRGDTTRSSAASRAAAVSAPPPPPAPVDTKVSANNYCDFCLGDAAENKKTKEAEELVSCSDCGRSGHPTCLQFTDNMIISVKKYPWQCIECKSCGLCGTSDNDDQLLFCDDCDRGYHMYCLKPPLSEPPEGSWSCHLCIEEFHGGKKPAGMI